MNKFVKTIDIRVNINPLMFDNINEIENVIDITNTLAHEFFLHAINTGVRAQVQLENKNLSKAADILSKKYWDSGDTDYKIVSK